VMTVYDHREESLSLQDCRPQDVKIQTPACQQ